MDERASQPRGPARARGPRRGRDPRADRARAPRRRRRPATGAGRIERREPQVERLGGAEQLDREDLLDVLQDRPGVPRGDRAHRHVVLLVRATSGSSRPTPGGPAPCSRTRGPRPCTGRSSAPSSEPGSRSQERRQAAVQARVHAAAPSAAREIDPSSASASFAKSSARAIGSPWKLPPLITRPPPVASGVVGRDAALGEHERVVGRGVELDVEDPAEVVERVADRAVDLRHAAQRVRVLDLVRARRGARAGAPSRAAGGGARRRPRPGPGAAGRAGTARRTRPRSRAAPRRSSPRRRDAVRVSRSASARSSAPSADISWVPLRSARPSFASSVSGSRPTSRSATSAGHDLPVELHLAPPDERQREVRERREVAGRADAPLLRHDRVDARARRSSQIRSTSSGRQPEWPSASVFARSRSIARTTSRGNGRADARRVRGEEVLLEARRRPPAG